VKPRQSGTTLATLDNTGNPAYGLAAVGVGRIRVAQGLSKARFLTVQEVADLMRVSSMTVYRLIKAGDLPAVRVGRSFRVSELDVDTYLASRYTQAG
jgi:excisionase family DNA binding protein